MILKKETIMSINKGLSLPSSGTEQDWDIEMADSKRLSEFISYYENTSLTEDEKVALMSLILASYNDFLSEENSLKVELWSEIREKINPDKTLFLGLLDYWGMEEEHSEGEFKIASLIREIKNSTEQ